MQRKKNIRLLIILATVVLITVATYFLVQPDKSYTVPDPALFSMDDVSQIDSVVLRYDDTQRILHYHQNEWLVNDRYVADSRKLTVLFAILNQVRAKRPVAQAEHGRVDSLFQTSGVDVTFYEGGNRVKEFSVAGLEEEARTYFRSEEGTYVVSIPGYRSYLAAIFEMNTSGWRDKLVFDEVSWNNLERIDIGYPSGRTKGFSVVPDENYFTIEGLAATDSLKLLDYIDRISVLMAEDYFEKAEEPDSLGENKPLMNIAVTDIRNRPFTLSIYPPEAANKGYIAVKDTTEWLRLNRQQVDPIIKDQSFFTKGSNSQR